MPYRKLFSTPMLPAAIQQMFCRSADAAQRPPCASIPSHLVNTWSAVLCQSCIFQPSRSWSQPYAFGHIVMPQSTCFLTESTSRAPDPLAEVTQDATRNAKLLANLYPAVGCIDSAYQTQQCQDPKDDPLGSLGLVTLCSRSHTSEYEDLIRV